MRCGNRASKPLRVPALRRYLDFHPVELVRQQNLARKTAGRGDICGEVEHIFLFLAGGWQFGEPFTPDHHMAGGARHLPFASAFQRHPGALRYLEQHSAGFGRSFDPLVVACDEGDANYASPCCNAARLSVSAASSSSDMVVYRPKPSRIDDFAAALSRPMA